MEFLEEYDIMSVDVKTDDENGNKFIERMIEWLQSLNMLENIMICRLSSVLSSTIYSSDICSGRKMERISHELQAIVDLQTVNSRTIVALEGKNNAIVDRNDVQYGIPILGMNVFNMFCMLFYVWCQGIQTNENVHF